MKTGSRGKAANQGSADRNHVSQPDVKRQERFVMTAQLAALRVTRLYEFANKERMEELVNIRKRKKVISR